MKINVSQFCSDPLKSIVLYSTTENVVLKNDKIET